MLIWAFVKVAAKSIIVLQQEILWVSIPPCSPLFFILTKRKTNCKEYRKFRPSFFGRIVLFYNVQGQRGLSSLVRIPLASILLQNEHNKPGILLAKLPFYSRFCGILNITKDLKEFLLQGLFYVCILLFERGQTPLKEAYRKPCVYIVSYVCCQFKHTLFFSVNY